jgi:hypothetical protein
MTARQARRRGAAPRVAAWSGGVASPWLACAVVLVAALAFELSHAFPASGEAPGAAPKRHVTRGAPARRALPSRTVTIAWAGDTVLGSTFGLPPEQGRTMLAHVAPVFRAADAGWVNLEEALSNTTTAKCAGATPGTCYAFGAPTSYARTLPASGIRIVNLANNHADDYGAAGQASTLGALRAAHVAWDGKPGEIEVLRIHGVRVAFLGFAPYKWASRLDNIPAAVELVKRAAAKADVVVVAIHAGAEGSTADHVPTGTEYFLGENRGNSRAFAHAVIDAGADLVVGSGPHVIRGVQWYQGKLIAYSLGNLAGWHTFGMGGTLSKSGILTVTIRGDGSIAAGRWTSLLLEEPGVPVIDSGRQSLTLVQQLSREDFGPVAARFSTDGALTLP